MRSDLSSRIARYIAACCEALGICSDKVIHGFSRRRTESNIGDLFVIKSTLNSGLDDRYTDCTLTCMWFQSHGFALAEREPYENS